VRAHTHTYTHTHTHTYAHTHRQIDRQTDTHTYHTIHTTRTHKNIINSRTQSGNVYIYVHTIYFMLHITHVNTYTHIHTLLPLLLLDEELGASNDANDAGTRSFAPNALLQCVAVCCSALQRVEVCCRVCGASNDAKGLAPTSSSMGRFLECNPTSYVCTIM